LRTENNNSHQGFDTEIPTQKTSGGGLKPEIVKDVWTSFGALLFFPAGF